ncbi:MAG: hypothetical protein ABJO54_18245 [Hyphomicrobiales bacterium]
MTKAFKFQIAAGVVAWLAFAPGATAAEQISRHLLLLVPICVHA